MWISLGNSPVGLNTFFSEETHPATKNSAEFRCQDKHNLFENKQNTMNI